MSQKQQIAVNQLGYRPQDAKTAVLVGGGGKVRLEDAASGDVVWTGEADAAQLDASSGLEVSRVDFTSWRKPGTYRLRAEDGIESSPFTISGKVYDEAHRSLLKAFYYFRCGMELTPEFAGPWTHGPCHCSDAIVYGEPERSVVSYGGWHDAGDYGKYAGPGAKAVADLLLAFDLYPRSFQTPIPIPETGADMPDVLHECRYELEWLLRVQDDRTGGVFHKLTTLRFPTFDAMPEEDTADLYLSPISATATGCFAGVMALAARIYKPYDEAFSSRCLSAAQRAWTWLQANPQVPGFRNPPDIVTGEYGDELDADERYWAAAELYRTTGDEEYHQAFLKLAEDERFDKYELGWADMGGYGTVSYLLSDRRKAASVDERLHAGLMARAYELAQVSEQDGFGVSLRPEQYVWGSNMLVLNNGMLLLLADRIAGTPRFEARALAQLDYLFGVNGVGMSYVTGLGDRPIRHPHHRPSEGDKVEEPVPGLVSGGPNVGLQDDYAKEELAGKAPALAFADVMESYSTNEVTIYWNSPAVFVVSHYTSAAVE